MTVILRNIQIPLFIKIERGILKTLGSLLEEHHLYFQKPLIISEETILELGGNDAVQALNHPATILFTDNTIAIGDAIAAEVRNKGNDLIVSIGGGRIVDLGKYVATKSQTNYISVPTSPSNDGICSPVAVLKNDSGQTESISVNMPIGILVDTAMLTSAPAVNVRAGIGDLISNLSAIADWKLAYKAGKEAVDDFAASIATSAAELVYETCRGTNIDVRGEEFLKTLVHGLILSGIAMNIAGNSRPCSGAEHKLSHAIDHLYPGVSMHGLQVAYGTLLCNWLRGEAIDHLLELYHNTQLPILSTDLGLSEEQIVEAWLYAPQTRSGRYTIIEQLHLSREEISDRVTAYHVYIKNKTREL